MKPCSASWNQQHVYLEEPSWNEKEHGWIGHTGTNAHLVAEDGGGRDDARCADVGH